MGNPICLHISHSNINLDAFFEMKDVTAQEYMFMSVIERYQTMTGWCEPKVGNNLTYKTGLIGHISSRVRYSRQGGEKAYHKLIRLGYLEESPCTTKFHLTPKYFVLSNPPKDGQAEKEAKSELVSIAKFSYLDTIYAKDFGVFTSELKELCKKLPDNTDFTYYFERIKDYYTKENPSLAFTLEGWKVKLKSWLNRDIQGRRVQLVKVEAAKTTGGELVKEGSELLDNVTKWAAKVFYPTLNDKNYKGTIDTFIDYATKAAKKSLLQDKTVVFLEEMKALRTSNDIKAYYQKRLISQGLVTEGATSATTGAANTEGVQTRATSEKTATTGANTEGVQMRATSENGVVEDILKLTKTLKI